MLKWIGSAYNLLQTKNFTYQAATGLVNKRLLTVYKQKVAIYFEGCDHWMCTNLFLALSRRSEKETDNEYQVISICIISYKLTLLL